MPAEENINISTEKRAQAVCVERRTYGFERRELQRWSFFTREFESYTHLFNICQVIYFYIRIFVNI